jgi:hypothetical protein
VARADSTLVAHARWVRAEARRADGGMVAFTNPIWLGRHRIELVALRVQVLKLAAPSSTAISGRGCSLHLSASYPDRSSHVAREWHGR